MTRPKGRNSRQARPGNKNTASGPRVGRRESAEPVPVGVPRQRRRRKRAKVGGRDFQPGQNSHDGTVFRRGPDLIPRGNGTLMLRCVFHDAREKLYRNLCRLVDTPKGALAFMQEYIDRTEGRPARNSGSAGDKGGSAIFVFTTPDGRQVPASPPRQLVRASASPPASSALSADDALILGLGHGDGAAKERRRHDGGPASDARIARQPRAAG